MKKLAYTRADLRQMVRAGDRAKYDQAIKVYMNHTGKFPPAWKD